MNPYDPSSDVRELNRRITALTDFTNKELSGLHARIDDAMGVKRTPINVAAYIQAEESTQLANARQELSNCQAQVENQAAQIKRVNEENARLRADLDLNDNEIGCLIQRCDSLAAHNKQLIQERDTAMKCSDELQATKRELAIVTYREREKLGSHIDQLRSLNTLQIEKCTEFAARIRILCDLYLYEPLSDVYKSLEMQQLRKRLLLIADELDGALENKTIQTNTMVPPQN